MEEAYRKSYRELYFGHWWWRAREEIIVDALRQAGLTRGGHILDVGCGGGLLFPRLAEFGEVEGIEADTDSAHESSSSNKIHIGTFDQSFKPPYRYELILLLDVLEHLPDPEAVLAHAVDLLTPSGLVMVTLPALNSLWTTHDDLNQHLRRYSKASFGKLAQLAGLNLRYSRYIFYWLALGKLMVRAKEGIVSTKPTPPGIPPRLINETLYRACLWEDAILRRFPIPFGNSLIAIGERARPPRRVDSFETTPSARVSSPGTI
ncbi:MAG TPA: class I SAM-dependent methyltransferase [Candidatus Binataceae bacterium]|nr:class I SAM-dependent methyltransferase [Candidatus Binataceae bacterium]